MPFRYVYGIIQLLCNLIDFFQTVAHTGETVVVYPAANIPRQYIAYPRKLNNTIILFIF